ncbi:MAG: pyridoxamine 5'-phosphate oxidase [Candidatus Kryptoniota bacterium]
MTRVNEYIKTIRKEYSGRHLDEKNVLSDPIKQFESWLAEAVDARVDTPNAMVLATATGDGLPSARVVLLRDLSSEGLVFYTNYNSRKARDLSNNPAAAAVFYWPELDRQVRIEGNVSKTSPEISDEYFNSRPKESRIAAIVSPQSEIISDRSYLEELFKSYLEQLTDDHVPRPAFWGGYILHPERIEFWQGRENRLHDRILYIRKGHGWSIVRLAP